MQQKRVPNFYGLSCVAISVVFILYVSIYANHPSGDSLTYVPDSIPMGNDADETQLYEVPDSQLVNTPFMKEALSKEAAGCAEALLGKNSRIYPLVS